MKQIIELGAARICAVIQDVSANVDFEVASLPGGSLIAVLLWLYAIAMGSIRCAATQNRASRPGPKAHSAASERLPVVRASVARVSETMRGDSTKAMRDLLGPRIHCIKLDLEKRGMETDCLNDHPERRKNGGAFWRGPDR